MKYELLAFSQNPTLEEHFLNRKYFMSKEENDPEIDENNESRENEEAEIEPDNGDEAE